MHALLIYPHQLFRAQSIHQQADLIVLIEEPLLFTQYRFHAQKLVLHRASMKQFESELLKAGQKVAYLESSQLKNTADVANHLKRLKVTQVSFFDLTDDWLNQRLTAALRQAKIPFEVVEHPHFLTTPEQFDDYVAGKKKLFFTDFYIQQRKRLKLLVDKQLKPVDGKWSFDTENRKKLPRDVIPPSVAWPKEIACVKSAKEYVQQNFPNAIGLDSIAHSQPFRYPVTESAAQACLSDFLDQRFENFGIYEDAIDVRSSVLFHSVLTPALNIGLLSPRQVVEAAIDRIENVPMNSLEGFVRQIIGWREFILGVYRQMGRRQRSINYWQHHRSIPASLYDGTTGIEPVDVVITRTLQHAYCHHIERLMILGNFMLLCEIAPEDIYLWFMELFIDAYDWVMVPNVFGMSQFADGGLITTKPYISGSSYVLKMSNFKRGAWCEVWDALYWRFIHLHRDFFSSNPRMSVMVAQCNKMGSKLDTHLSVAEKFLEKMHAER